MKKSIQILFVLYLVLGLMFQGLSVSAFATDDEEGAPEKQDENTSEEPVEKTPAVHTVVSAWDILLDPVFDMESGSEDGPARLFKYIDEEIDESIEAEIDKQVEEADALAEKLAKKEAEQFARELVANGRYKELIGEENSYHKSWADDEDDDEEDEDFDEEYADEEEEDVDEYYLGIAKKYPHILEFWFEKDGHYYFDYDSDYSGIDFDAMYYEVPHDTFHVTDRLEYTDFEPGVKYTVIARLVRLEDSEGPAESTVKEIKKEFTASDEGSGTIELDFGELKLDYGYYVVTAEIKDESDETYLEHNDLANKFESIEVVDEYGDAKAAAEDLGARQNRRGEGYIAFPAEKAYSPNTGDNTTEQILFYAVVIMICVLSSLVVIYRRYIEDLKD